MSNTREFELSVHTCAPYPQSVRVKTTAKSKSGILRAFARAAVDATGSDVFSIGTIFERAADGVFEETARLSTADDLLVFKYARDYVFSTRY